MSLLPARGTSERSAWVEGYVCGSTLMILADLAWRWIS
jgi:hypothetical protein